MCYYKERGEKTMETENKIPEELPQEGYVPRPAWQVWAARLGLVLAIAFVAVQVLQIAGGGL